MPLREFENREVDHLTIRVAGKNEGYITADSFLEVVREAVSILRDLDADRTLVWKLKEASISSPLSMTFIAEPRPGVESWRSDVSSSYLGLFERLDRGEESLPANVPGSAIIHAKRLVNVLNDGVSTVTFSGPNHDPVTPTQRVQATVAGIVASHRETFSDYGRLEGTLEGISVHAGTTFAIYDRVTGGRIVCAIPHELVDKAKAALEQRVWVRGRIKYKSGKPISIAADEFDVMPPRSELPGFEDIQGIDVTGGMDSVEFIRRQRDAD